MDEVSKSRFWSSSASIDPVDSILSPNSVELG